jgi:lipopolysaccharide biosynthesis protein
VHFGPNYQGTVVNYADLAAGALANQPSAFRLFPGVCPSWDNEARRPSKGLSIIGSTPAAYHDWLAAACRSTLTNPDPGERIVFINAWNEWAEGAHLEPDRHFGYAYLSETARVVSELSNFSAEAKPQMIPSHMSTSPRQTRTLGSLPGLVVKNLAFQCANVAEATAQLLRRLVANLK